MKKNTRFAFNAYLQQLARLNGVAVEELSSKFTMEPSVQQTLEDQIQQSAAFLTLINVTPVTEQSGQLLGLGVGSTIAGTTDTTAKEREPVDPTLMVDVEPAKKESTTVKRKRRTKKQKKEPEAKQGDYLVGTDENVLVLNRTYANRSNAERAAKMQWERLQRGVASFSLQLAEGRADLYTEMPVKVSGFKQPIDDAEWTITTLTHTVSPDNGFTTSLELEVRIDDFEME
ncbi:P2 family phage major capsid protein [Escherichia coli]|uniref:P2 family phage major capsid protein n=1 Tax=Escherichia coli TaxID=562 RepID=UPI001CDAA751|nr:P2 family phage major capsid protein [Escherichia coli]